MHLAFRLHLDDGSAVAMDFNGRGAVASCGMHVVVAGGAGFLGSHLCAKLLQRGCSVLAVDNLSAGSMRNIVSLFGRGDFHFVRHDVVLPVTLQTDWIFNMTCCASPWRYRDDAEQIARTCTDGVLNLLRQAQECHARIFLASNGASNEDEWTYGGPGRRSNVQDRGWIRGCFNETRRYAEGIFVDFHHTRDVDIKIARVFDVYGPHMQLDNGGVIADFILRALRDEPLMVPMDDRTCGSFCYVDDLIDGVLRVMAAPKTLVGPVNLGSPARVPIVELAQRIISITGSKSSLVSQPRLAHGFTDQRPDFAGTQAACGWSSRVPLDVGLVHTIRWFDRVLSTARAQVPVPHGMLA